MSARAIRRIGLVIIAVSLWFGRTSQVEADTAMCPAFTCTSDCPSDPTQWCNDRGCVGAGACTPNSSCPGGWSISCNLH